MYKRIQTFQKRGRESCFLWGPRQTGKTTFLKATFPTAPYYDLLLPSEFARLSRNPGLLGEELLAKRPVPAHVIIDEVQKIPPLLDLVQWLIVNHRMSFILCGSSARKLKRGGGNLLGGRALRYQLFPLVSAEIPNFNLECALNHGLLPRLYPAENADKMMEAYVGEYLKEEIAAEALVRNIPAFQKFLEAASFSNGESVVLQNIASDCGVSSPTVRSYFEIIEDTLIGRFLPSFQKRAKRRVIEAPRFYFFDVGLANYLLKRPSVKAGGELFGKAFEQFIFQELSAHSHYSGKNYPLAYWRTTSQLEVDFILGDGEVALEVKGVPEVRSRDLRGLRAFREEFKPRSAFVVSLDKEPRLAEGIEILPWRIFLKKLWNGDIL